MKQRFSALDVRAIVTELRSRILNLRIQNIYDLTPKSFLLKFSEPEHKEYLLVESGFRIHLTSFVREKNDSPSHFVSKLRKSLRGRRVTGIRQLGVDRTIEMEFGGAATEEYNFFLYLEFYAAGNVILTDGSRRILSILRVVNEDNLKCALNEVYSLENVQTFQKQSRESLEALIMETQEKERLEGKDGKQGKEQIEGKQGKEGKQTIKKFLNFYTSFGPSLCDHCLAIAGIPSSTKLSNIQLDSAFMDSLMAGIEDSERILLSMESHVEKGILLLNQTSDFFEEYQPFLFKSLEGCRIQEFPSFNEAVDHFYSLIEAQKLESKTKQQEEMFVKKLEAIRAEQESRVVSLENVQKQHLKHAMLIEMNIENVDKAILVIVTALANGIDWKELHDLVAAEKKKGNPIALLINSLKLSTNQIALKLPDEDDVVLVDISLSAHANAKKYYDLKKLAQQKQERTIKANKQALKSAEAKIKSDLKQVRLKAAITKVRKVFWFEKFSWFISSENYLVIAGKDQQQNELLVKRHLKKGDVYVHADIHGASSVVIKNHRKPAEIPPVTLSQAGCMSMCQSKAWDAKIVTSAWWVYDDQVSKTAPSGEFLTTGSFMVRGKKNFLPPSQLVYGFALMFRVDESCIASHVNERKVREDLIQEEKRDYKELIEQVELEEEEDFPDTTVEMQNLEKKFEEKFELQDKKMKPEKTEKIVKNEKSEKNEIPGKNEKQMNSAKPKNSEKPGSVRGKKGKLKKIKEKYKNQDEEERQIKMELLGSISKKKVESPKPQPQKSTEKKQPKQSAIKQTTLDEQNEEENEEVEVDDHAIINCLTGQPLPEDILLYAVPVCAPYIALTNYKYKVKLTPGQLKKGKAVKTCMSLFLSTCKDDQKDKDESMVNAAVAEKNLIKSMNEMEMISQMLGKVKISAPNLEVVKSKSKKKK